MTIHLKKNGKLQCSILIEVALRWGSAVVLGKYRREGRDRRGRILQITDSAESSVTIAPFMVAGNGRHAASCSLIPLSPPSSHSDSHSAKPFDRGDSAAASEIASIHRRVQAISVVGTHKARLSRDLKLLSALKAS